MDRIIIRQVEEMPRGEALETALHSKRRRVWQPPDGNDITPSTRGAKIKRGGSAASTPSTRAAKIKRDASAASAPSTRAAKIKCGGSAASTSSTRAAKIKCGGSAASTPSPRAAKIKFGGSAANTSSTRAAKIKCDGSAARNVMGALNYGSDPSSSENEDDVESEVHLSRVIASLLDTPVDEDADDDELVPSFLDASTFDVDVDPMATDQPRSFCDFNWENFPSVPLRPESRRERFSNNNVGPTTPCVDPYDIFVAIWDRQFMEHIAFETNRYAQQLAHQMMLDNRLYPRSRISRWCDTTADELYVYFAILLAMGILVKSQLAHYWSANSDIFYTPGFKAHMPLHKFLLISRCLHFANNRDICPSELSVSEAKLFKIAPVLTHLNTKFETMYRLSQNISIDESLLMWKGWLDISQLIPNKAATVGIKTYEVCESQTGYLWRFEVHTQKPSPPQQLEDPLSASTPSIVLRLLDGLQSKGHTVWMDNFYNSPLLARRLKSLGFDCVGTLRTSRKFVPQALNSLTKENMGPGQMTGLTSGDVDILVWRDKNRVATISTYHGNAVVETRGSIKPTLIIDYNLMMGGVDKKDQMLAMYPIERKRTKVWYKKLFRRLLNVSVLNSYIIHKKSSPEFSTPHLSHREFRVSLINSLLSKHASSTASSVPSSTVTITLPSASSSFRPMPTVQNVDLTHRIEQYPNTAKDERIRRNCVVCKKRVRTFCTGCNKTVCAFACNIVLHPSAKL